MDREELFDYNTIAQRSDIDLDGGNNTGSLGLQGWVIESTYADFIVAEYIDMNGGFQTAKNGLVTVDTKTKSWRKGIVRVVSPIVEKMGQTKVGDVIMFPNDKGLPTGALSYRGKDGKVHNAENCIFLNEQRIFAKITEDKS